MNPRWLNVVKEYGEALLIALVLAFFIRSFVVQAYKIPSGSMLDTLKIGDHLLVNKFTYGLRVPFTDMFFVRFGKPEFQDIVVFEFPEDPSKDFIKRVIGVPGDTIEIKNKQVYRNGKKLNEPYAQHTDSQTLPQRDNMAPLEVSEGEYFVMGDNRDESYDSRFWGCVEQEEIMGRAWVIYWSWRGFDDIRWNRIGDVIN